MQLAVKIISFYQKYLSFDRGALFYLGFGPACRQEISCSEYTKRAIMENGVLKGSFLGLKRIINCR